jgi:hypothetical protein
MLMFSPMKLQPVRLHQQEQRKSARRQSESSKEVKKERNNTDHITARKDIKTLNVTVRKGSEAKPNKQQRQVREGCPSLVTLCGLSMQHMCCIHSNDNKKCPGSQIGHFCATAYQTLMHVHCTLNSTPVISLLHILLRTAKNTLLVLQIEAASTIILRYRSCAMTAEGCACRSLQYMFPS